MSNEASENLFKKIKREKFELIERIVNERWQESINLEFKCLEKHRTPITESDRLHIAKVFSGFANSDGGIVIWGIDARKDNVDEYDSARQLMPISNIKSFLSTLEREASQSVSPGIEGTLHTAIYIPHQTDQGFVASFIPKSEHRIHMTLIKNSRAFYYRSGDSFLPMETYMIEDRLGKRPRPKLEFYYRLEPGQFSGNNIGIRIVFGIKNTGLGLALYPAVTIYQTEAFRLDGHPLGGDGGLDGTGRTGIPERIRTPDRYKIGPRTFAGGTNDVIHSGTSLDVTSTNKEISREAAIVSNIKIEYEIYCDGYSSKGSCVIDIESYFRNSRGF